jgi:hypothetical protein
LKEKKIMKTLTTLAAGAAVLLALASPTLAASRQHADSDVNTVRTYGDQDISNPPSRSGYGSYARDQNSYQDNSGHPYHYAPGQNLPYPDRPYGDPDVD